MVIVHLMGGLGNQLFQYAAARQIAHRLHTTLKLDGTSFASDPLRAYSLHPFRIQEQFASPEDLAAMRRPYESRLAWYMLRLSQVFHLPYGWTVLQENQIRPFDPRLMKVSGNVYLKGYWQSEKYFDDIRDIIRHEFTLKHEPDPVNRDMAEMIGSVESVSIHVRRGDYVQNSRHGTCSLIYYQSCIAHIAAQVFHPHFFVFSDDPDWAQENLHLAHPVTFVTHNSAAPHEDLHLMSLCQHHIIANSSFSWWGAWLNPKADKMVLAPRRWFREPGMDERDLLPGNWVRT